MPTTINGPGVDPKTLNISEDLQTFQNFSHDTHAVAVLLGFIVVIVFALVILAKYYDMSLETIEGRLLPKFKLKRRPATIKQPSVVRSGTTCTNESCPNQKFIEVHKDSAIINKHEVALYNDLSKNVFRQIAIDELLTTTLYQMNKVEKHIRKLRDHFKSEFILLLDTALAENGIEYDGALSTHPECIAYQNALDLSMHVIVKGGIRYALNNNHIPDPHSAPDAFKQYINEVIEGIAIESIDLMDERYRGTLVTRKETRSVAVQSIEDGTVYRIIHSMFVAAIKERKRIGQKIARMESDLARELNTILYSHRYRNTESISISGTKDASETMDTLRSKYDVSTGD